MKQSDYICPVCGTTKQPGSLCQENEQLKAELKKETELRMFFEKACRWLGNESFKQFAGRGQSDDKWIQVISRGKFIDDSVGNGSLYQVEVFTIRLNHVLLNDWIMSECWNTRDCYEDGPEGDAQWLAHKAERAERRRLWKEKIVRALEIDPKAGSVCITQSLSEIFAVVHIIELKERDELTV